MFAGLSAFPLTPFADDQFDADMFSRLVNRLARAGVDSIGALGSTGSYAYLTAEERRLAVRVAVDAADGTPVIVSAGAITLREVLTHLEDAHEAGASGVLLTPMAYQPLTSSEVYELFAAVSAHSTLPIVLYDNPRTTGFAFSDDLYASICALPNIASIKMPSLPSGATQAAARVEQLHGLVPAEVSIGISGDAAAARGLLAGCDVWYSVLAGILPRTCVQLARTAITGDAVSATALSEQLAPVWDLFETYGSYRAASAIADELGVLRPESLHRPVLPLAGSSRDRLRAVVASLPEEH